MPRHLFKTRPFESVILVCAALFLGGFAVWGVLTAREPAATVYARVARQLELAADLRATLDARALAVSQAVLAADDAEAARFAQQAARLGEHQADARAELEGLLDPARQQAETALLRDFDRATQALRDVDEALLALSGRNTNLKAYDLAYGPAAQAAHDMDSALAAVAPAERRLQPDAAVLALKAQVALYRLLALLPPHIAEADPARMDAMETAIAQEKAQALAALNALAALPGAGASPALAQARQAFDAFCRLTDRIVALSRENTNVLSLELLLGRRRNAQAVCQDALGALERALRGREFKASR